MKRLYLIIPAALALLCSQSAAADSTDFAKRLAGNYYSVENDWMYGVFEQDCSIFTDSDGKLYLNDFPVLEGFDVEGYADEEASEIRFANGQEIYEDSYGNKKYFWVAAPDDPDMNYNVEIDDEIVFKVDPESGVLSWKAPVSDDGSAWLRFMMVGGYYFDPNAQKNKVSGLYHFTEAKLYPVNSIFTATRIDPLEDTDPDTAHTIHATISGNTLRLHGLLHLDHDSALEFELNPDAKTAIAKADGLFCDNEEYGKLYVMPLGDETEFCATAEVSDTETVLSLPDFKAQTEFGDLKAGHYSGATVTIPFDIFAQCGESKVDRIEEALESEVTYYTLQGIRATNPGNGIFIRRQGSKSERVYMK